MRKITAIAAALGAAVLAAVVPAAGAQAAPVASTASPYCDYLWNGKDNNGNPLATWNFFYAYVNTNCDGYLGRSDGQDANWGNDQGAFQGTDIDRASSLLLKTADATLAIKVFDGTGEDWGGAYSCVRGDEFYVASLHDAADKFTNGSSAADRISSHKRVPASDCNGNWLH
ncbi:hypothetical protein [Streptomyces gardneri]|uniref:hypothetical protein n=1 Tax=Streptomyces gardneri TaxID=66892 RepID=UPI0035DCCD47